jgi:Ca2+/H+ antiporter
VVVAALPVLQIVLPLSLIIVAFWRSPHSMAVLLPETPIPFIAFPIVPHESSISMSLAQLVGTLINTVSVLLKAFLFQVIGELSLKYLFFSHQHAPALHSIAD